MTEAEWLAATDPSPMLGFLNGTASDRKLRLLTVAASQHIRHLLPKRASVAAGVLELYADGLISTAKYREAWSDADIESRMCAQDPPDATTYAVESVLISDPPTTTSVEYALSTATFAFGCAAAENVAEQDYDSVVESGRLRAANEHCCFIRCVFGNPFRSVAVQSSWLTSTVLELARQMYESRDFSPMPILADALQDAGCDSDDILNHCRGAGPHVRGCWVVDLILGKS